MDEGRDGPEAVHIQPVAERGVNLRRRSASGRRGIELEELGHKALFVIFFYA